MTNWFATVNTPKIRIQGSLYPYLHQYLQYVFFFLPCQCNLVCSYYCNFISWSQMSLIIFSYINSPVEYPLCWIVCIYPLFMFFFFFLISFVCWNIFSSPFICLLDLFCMSLIGEKKIWKFYFDVIKSILFWALWLMLFEPYSNFVGKYILLNCSMLTL